MALCQATSLLGAALKSRICHFLFSTRVTLTTRPSAWQSLRTKTTQAFGYRDIPDVPHSALLLNRSLHGGCVGRQCANEAARFSTSSAFEREWCPFPEYWRRPQEEWTVSYCPRWTHYRLLVVSLVSTSNKRWGGGEKEERQERSFSLTRSLLIKDEGDFLHLLDCSLLCLNLGHKW